MDDVMIPTFGADAFDERFTPQMLFGIATTAPPIPEAEEAVEVLFGYCHDWLTILALPEYVK